MKLVRVRNMILSQEYLDRSIHEKVLILTSVEVMIMERALYIIRMGLPDSGEQRCGHLYILSVNVA